MPKNLTELVQKLFNDKYLFVFKGKKNNKHFLNKNLALRLAFIFGNIYIYDG